MRYFLDSSIKRELLNTMKKIIGILLGLGVACGANAEILAGYDFSSSKSAATVASGASAGVVTAAGGTANNYTLVTSIGDNTGEAASGTAFGSTSGGCISSTSEGCTGGDLTGAISDGDYYSITITADEAGTLDLTGFSIDKAIASAFPERVADEWNVCAKVNGDSSAWSSADALMATSLATTTAQGLSEWESTFIDLSTSSSFGTQFQGLDSVEFRIYVWGANGTSYSNAQRIDQVVIEGSVPEAPETVFSSDTVFNLARYQSRSADSANSSTPAQYGNDGFVTQENRWVSDSSGPHWYEVALAVSMEIGSAHLYSGATSTAAISDIVLQYYNGTAWVDIAGTVVSGNTRLERNLEFDAPVTAQRFRLYTTDETARIRELALYPPTSDGLPVPFGMDLDLNIAKLRQYAVSSIDGENYPGEAIDGYVDDFSAWASTNAAGPHQFQVHFPQNELIRGIHLYSGFEGQTATVMEDLTVDYHDGSDWVTFPGGSVSGNTDGELSLWFDSAVAATKVRVYTTDSKQAVIRELVVFAENSGDEYPLWTDALDETPPSESFLDYEDSYYTIENRSAGLNLSTSTNGSFTTSDEPWFQVLLNIGTDTYRLRSKDSERCFEVSLASTNEGAAIVEGDYSGMPHQRWRLVDTGDGSHFQMVNVWSGLVLGLDGTNVVQQTSSSATTQQWAINYETHFPKKGQASHLHFNYMFEPGWAYNWQYDDESMVDVGQYYPMQWGGMASSTAGILRYQPEWYGRANNTIALGFNEPDLHDQSNLAEDTAAYQWPRMQRMRLPLGGPCPANYQGSWRQGFEALAEEEGLRSDYMTMHNYAPNGAQSGSPSTLINKMQSLYNTYGKKIILTEFSTRDFDGNKTSWSRNHNYNWLAEFMWRAESLNWLKGWSLFEWGYGGNVDTTDGNGPDVTAMNSPKLALHYSNDSSDPGYEDLMECGLLLAGWDGVDEVVDDKPYIIHNKGRFLRLIDDPASNAVTYADVTHTDQTEQFVLKAASSGTKYIEGLSSSRRLSYDGSSVGLAAAGTTGDSVEWELNEYQHGWFYIDHPSTSKRLRITDANVITVDNDTATYDNLRFRFIVPAVEFVAPDDAEDNVLVGYDFDVSSDAPYVASVASPAVSVTSLSSPMAISAVSTVGDNSGVDAFGLAFGSADELGCIGISVDDTASSSFAGAVAADEYMSFTVTPGDDRTLTLSSLSFKVILKATTSVDEYAVADSSGNLIGSAIQISKVVTDGLTDTYESVTVDLTGTTLETITEATEFRIYAWGRGTTSTGGTLATFDKLVLRGTAGPVLVGYDFDEGTVEATEVLSPSVTATAFTSPMDISFPTTIGDNSGVDAEGVALGNSGTFSCVGIGVDDATTASFAAAVAGDDYMTFTVTPDAQVSLDLEAITFKASKTASTSVDEYAVTDESGSLIGSAATITTTGQTTAYQAVSVDLSGNPAYQGLTEPVTFRIYAWGRGTTSTGGTLAMVDKVTLHGNIDFNTTPVAMAQSVSTAPNTAVGITLSGSDAENDSLTYSVVSAPANGTLSGTAPDLTYTPDSNYSGDDSFTFTVDDGNTVSDVASVSISVSAPINITLVGDGNGYDEANTVAWRSTNVDKLFDFDNDDVYGTEGLFFAGDAADGNGGGGQGFAQQTQVDADWATFNAGANLASVAEGATYSYALIDDPTLATGPDVADWSTIRSGGFVATTPSGAGSWCELVTFDIDDTTPSRFRVGLMAGNLNNENWNPSGLRLSVDGSTPVAVTDLPGTPVAQAGWVFFDVELNGNTSGTFSIEGQRRATTQGASLGGVTFDLPQASSYSQWASGYGLTGDDALAGADAENGGAGDGYDNLAEYALGMNPANADAGSRESVGTATGGGTNWFEYVHYRRSDYAAEGLSYWLIDTTDLIYGIPVTNGQDQILVGPAIDGYEPVTNRYEVDSEVKFIRLEIRQD